MKSVKVYLRLDPVTERGSAVALSLDTAEAVQAKEAVVA